MRPVMCDRLRPTGPGAGSAWVVRAGGGAVRVPDRDGSAAKPAWTGQEVRPPQSHP